MFNGVLLVDEIYLDWISPIIIDLDFTVLSSFCRVLLGLPSVYWVLLGLTGVYWVFQCV